MVFDGSRKSLYDLNYVLFSFVLLLFYLYFTDRFPTSNKNEAEHGLGHYFFPG